MIQPYKRGVRTPIVYCAHESSHVREMASLNTLPSGISCNIRVNLPIFNLGQYLTLVHRLNGQRLDTDRN